MTIEGVETDPEYVYEVAEDSVLLADAVRTDIDSPKLVLDVGTGSGYVAKVIDNACETKVVGSDINPHACREARATGFDVVHCDLVEAFESNSFDVVVFNPPYLPMETPTDGWFDTAVSGGPTGRDVINRFLTSVSRVLVPDGSVYLLVSSLDGVPEVTETATEAGFRLVKIAEDSYPGEQLIVFKLTLDDS